MIVNFTPAELRKKHSGRWGSLRQFPFSPPDKCIPQLLMRVCRFCIGTLLESTVRLKQVPVKPDRPLGVEIS